MKYLVYIATSLDGFIARTDGSLDWLEGSDGDQNDHDAGEDYGFSEVMAEVDTMVMGRATYEFVASTGQWIYEGKRVIVLSSSMSDDDVAHHLRSKVEILSMKPRELGAKLESDGSRVVYVDGGVTIQRFLRAGMISELILTRVPVLIGSGIPLFGGLDADVHLTHVSSKSFSNGMVQSKYTINRKT